MFSVGDRVLRVSVDPWIWIIIQSFGLGLSLPSQEREYFRVVIMCVGAMMFKVRTTLDIDDEILEVARSLATHRKESIGRVISDMARNGLNVRPPLTGPTRNGVRVIERAANAKPVTLDVVNNLRDER
jgi:hypothetical protein